MLSEHVRSKIKKEIRKLRCELLLARWNFKIKFQAKLEDEVIMQVRYKNEYLHATIEVSEDAVAEMLKNKKEGWFDVRGCILHEMVHLLLADVVTAGQDRHIDQDSFRKAHEATTSLVERVLEPLIYP